MTVMATNTREFDIDTLVLTAYQYAGLVNELQTAQGPHWEARSEYGRKMLETIVDRLGADGIFERSMEFYDVAVPADAQSVQMPADTLDIRGPARVVQEDGSEFELDSISRQEYFDIPIKDTQGSPAQVYLARCAPMRLYVWPVSEAGCTIRVQRQRLSFDNSAGAATVDLERYWTDYLLHELAARLVITAGLPMDRAAFLQAKAQDAKRAAMGKSSGQLPNRAVLSHPGPWRGGY